jgi:adenylate cyclase
MAGHDETEDAPAELHRKDPPAGSGGGPVILDDMTTIGRSAGNTVALDDDMVSRNHALLRREEDGYVLVDLGSANGTFVNNRPISGPTTLQHGDEIRIGGAVFTFFDTDRPVGAPAGASVKATRRFFAEVNIAVLVSDIRNYTTLSEHIAADSLSSLLSDWFRRAGECIEQHAGIIEKFRGDSLMAYWMASKSAGSTHLAQALDTARDLVAASGDFDGRIRQYDAGQHFRIGCGIHVGLAVLGNIGADARRDFTTLGDCVNVTFRIESLCSSLDREILVSAEARELAPEALEFEDLGSHPLKGKAAPVRLFAL